MIHRDKDNEDDDDPDEAVDDEPQATRPTDKVEGDWRFFYSKDLLEFWDRSRPVVDGPDDTEMDRSQATRGKERNGCRVNGCQRVSTGQRVSTRVSTGVNGCQRVSTGVNEGVKDCVCVCVCVRV